MKVYYEKPVLTAEKLIKDILEISERYETITGKAPNKLVLTKEEFMVLDKYFSQYLSYQAEKEKADYLIFEGMEVILEE